MSLLRTGYPKLRSIWIMAKKRDTLIVEDEVFSEEDNCADNRGDCLAEEVVANNVLVEIVGKTLTEDLLCPSDVEIDVSGSMIEEVAMIPTINVVVIVVLPVPLLLLLTSHSCIGKTSTYLFVVPVLLVVENIVDVAEVCKLI
jgi:hypothetical protein